MAIGRFVDSIVIAKTVFLNNKTRYTMNLMSSLAWYSTRAGMTDCLSIHTRRTEPIYKLRARLDYHENGFFAKGRDDDASIRSQNMLMAEQNRAKQPSHVTYVFDNQIQVHVSKCVHRWGRRRPYIKTYVHGPQADIMGWKWAASYCTYAQFSCFKEQSCLVPQALCHCRTGRNFLSPMYGSKNRFSRCTTCLKEKL